MVVRFLEQAEPLDKSIQKIVRQKLLARLSRFKPSIVQVSVKILTTGNSPESSNYLCSLSVQIKNRGSFSVSSVGENMPIAAKLATGRAAERLQRILGSEAQAK